MSKKLLLCCLAEDFMKGEEGDNKSPSKANTEAE
jgi:hypothetical protein